MDNELFERTGAIDVKLTSDGQEIRVVPFIYTYAIVIQDPGAHWHKDRWCYERLEDALREMRTWDPKVTKEPNGWHRHPISGRRRPEGDPAREYICP